MTTLYNGTLTVQGLFTQVVGPAGITSAHTLVSILNNIEYASQQQVMMEIGSYNTNSGNLGNIYKYALGFSNSTNGTGGSFIIQACPVSTSTYTNINPPITLLTINTVNITSSVPLIVNGSGTFSNFLSLYNGNLQFNVANTGSISFQRDVWHNDLGGINRIYFGAASHTYFNSQAGYFFRSQGIDRLRIEANGNVVANGDITAFSDIRIKENIVTIDSPLEKINAMRGVYYTRIDTPGPRHIGVIAQEVEKVLPEVVLTSGPNENKSVAYANMVALLIEGIKEQGKTITQQQSTIQDLQGILRELQSKVEVIHYTLEEERVTLQGIQPMILDLENTIQEQGVSMETLQEIIGSLENLNTHVEVNEDKEVDPESSIQGVD